MILQSITILQKMLSSFFFAYYTARAFALSGMILTYNKSFVNTFLAKKCNFYK